MKRTVHIVSNYQQSSHDNDTWYVSTGLTAKLFRHLHKPVFLHKTDGSALFFLRDYLRILGKLKSHDIVYIIAAGGGTLDKFTLLKLLKPSVTIVWELHGPIEERYWFGKNLLARATVRWKNIIRKKLATYVSGAVCLSSALATYAQNQLNIKPTIVIPSYTDKNILKRAKSLLNKNRTPPSVFKKGLFFVYWSGTASITWHGLDMIESVAKYIYTKDLSIRFIVVGSHKWHRFKFKKNIIFYDTLPFVANIQMASYSDMGIALYRNGFERTSLLPFHLSPRKIVEHMALGKPVIASKIIAWDSFYRNGENIFLVPRNLHAIAQAILYCKNNPAVAQKVGKQAQHDAITMRSFQNLSSLMDTFLQNVMFPKAEKRQKFNRSAL